MHEAETLLAAGAVRAAAQEAFVTEEDQLDPNPPTNHLGRLAAGEVGMSMMTRIRGASNAKAKHELGWAPRHPNYREGFATAL